MTVLVTGATGFVGRSLLRRLLAEGRAVRAAVRQPAALPGEVEQVAVGEIGPDTDWANVVAGAEAVVHLAARVHIAGEDATGDRALYQRTNTEGSAALARAARRAGIRRFVFVSSTTVYGDRGHGASFDESSPPAPRSFYAASKLDAERCIAEVLRESGTELVILRPPLVYGPGAKGNFARVVRLVQRGLPLPLAWVRNRRSLVFVENLVDAIVTCLDHPAAAGWTFDVTDGQDVSTPELIARIARASGRPPRLFACPPALLRAVARLSGRGDEASRILDDMAVDSSRIRRELGWVAPFTLDEGMAQSVGERADREGAGR